MNRSILIVICDFIVSSMLALSSGLVPADNPFGTGAAQVVDQHAVSLLIAQLKREQQELDGARAELRRELDDSTKAEKARRALAELEKKLAATEAKLEHLEQTRKLRPENAGELTPAELQEKLQREILRRAEMRVRNDSLRYEIDRMRRQQESATGKLVNAHEAIAAGREKLAAAVGALDEARLDLRNVRAEAEQRGIKLAETGRELDRARTQLSGRETALAETRLRLETTEADGKKLRTSLADSEKQLAFTRGKVISAEKELAEAQSRYERAQRNLNSRELQLGEATQQAARLRNVIKTAVTDLSKIKGELETERRKANSATAEMAKMQGRAAAAEQEAASLKKLLLDAEHKLRNDVLKCYSSAVVELKIDIHEQRTLLDVTGRSTLFLPAVKLGERTVLLGDVRSLLGLRGADLRFERVNRLGYNGAIPGSKTAVPVAGPLTVLAERDLAMLPVPAGLGRTALRALKVNELKQRGIEDLYLFKCAGRENATLEGRVNFTPDGVLFIRNPSRSSDNVLRAEIGDFVLTKQGELVGVVAEVLSRDFGKRQEARCVLPAEHTVSAKSISIPFGKPDAAGIYTEFGAAAARLYREIERNDARSAR